MRLPGLFSFYQDLQNMFDLAYFATVILLNKGFFSDNITKNQKI